MMDTSDNVAIIALIVSLVALLVTSIQLAQAVSATADGYRRCSEFIIGPWHKLRHRVPAWSEFRVRTTYVTPQIMLVSPREFKEVEDNGEEIVRLCSPVVASSQLQKESIEVLKETVHLGSNALTPISTARAKLARGGFRNDDIEMQAKSQRDAVRTTVGKNQKARLDRAASQPTSSPVRQRKVQNELRVSWLRLLADLHSVHVSHRPYECQHCEKSFVFSLEHETEQDDSAYTELKQVEKEIPHLTRTDVAIVYKQWDWDFMPTEIARPLAEINLGDLVVLALRMGMQWRQLEPETSKLQADGNGYSLTGNEVKGLGIVVRLTAPSTARTFPKLVQSRAADKLLCGIIHGDPDLVEWEIPCVGRNRKRLEISDDNGLLFRLGLSRADIKKCKKHRWWETENDLYTLLMPFLPLPPNFQPSRVTGYYFPVWKPYMQGIFRLWEGRWTLYHRIKARIQHPSISGNLALFGFEKVYRYFATLERRYSDHFYEFPNRSSEPYCKASTLSSSEDIDWEEGLSITEYCRRAYNYTTAEFKSGSLGLAFDASYNQQKHYLHLVAAHVRMSVHAISEAKRQLTEVFPKQRMGDPHFSFQQFFKEHYGRDFVECPNVVWDMLELGKQYVDFVEKRKYSIAEYLEIKGVRNGRVSEIQAELAWWLLMLRGVAWTMSTCQDETARFGEPVPSSFFYDRTPILIT